MPQNSVRCSDAIRSGIDRPASTRSSAALSVGELLADLIAGFRLVRVVLAGRGRCLAIRVDVLDL